MIDEVANGLSYYDYTFFRELPRLYAGIEDELAAHDPKLAGRRLKPFLRVGWWIGGDRDGNPFVTAEVLSEAMRLQSAARSVIISRSCTSSAANCRSAAR